MSDPDRFPTSPTATDRRPRVALFVTCLVNVMRPTIADCTIALLEAAGADVAVPLDQTCCGQPAFNSGDEKGGARLAKRQIALLEPYDYVVLPSGSCASTIIHTWPESLKDEPEWQRRATALAGRTHEVLSFLTDVLKFSPQPPALRTTATYHDTCSGLRELGISAQPRQLLAAVEGLELRPLPDANVCCGFGGTFCVKYPAISNAIVGEKADAIESTGARMLLGGDLGCLMNMAGKLQRRGSDVRVYHTVEVLAGATDRPAIGHGSDGR
ncbi:(Fe-S)-binding protein [Aureimonas frigidaquae]|uniref:(Fe-S)-binding protein n=1 Tax=Aureimonas frigidaquae TaxID=424757 RepID=UPI000782ED4C|nr:(Fe-S)-binding protein [Aureimonas frigidaquae]